ncbi:RWP-RK domain-containing protein [Klebsormidium nitens]|uniref:RWP-RK domain-containing protein n=1 Tax=Klebsormidium nitens TaxID=105231 RepID=A0A1Y1HUF0_KLENI|nr:RWP-RK domain-containing protein [Klebsormidium nitens]|eukprot:GAQ80799.1 RWP-RK domain-containing protein [Klebsormidium nitens]
MIAESPAPTWADVMPRHQGMGAQPQGRSPSPEDHSPPGFKLDAIAVFQDREKQENIRSVQIYSQGGQYMALQQGFSLVPTGYYALHEPFGIFFSSEAESLRFMVRQKADRDWTCILDYADYLPAPASINPLLSPKSNPLLNMLPTIANDLTYVETVIELAKLGGQPAESASAACSKTSFATAGFGSNWARTPECRSFEELILRSPSPPGEMEPIPEVLGSFSLSAPPPNPSVAPPKENLHPLFPKAPSAPPVPVSNGFNTADSFTLTFPPPLPAPLTNFVPPPPTPTKPDAAQYGPARLRLAPPPEFLHSFSGPPPRKLSSPMGTVFLNIRAPKKLSPRFGGPGDAPREEPSTSSATSNLKGPSAEAPQSALSKVARAENAPGGSPEGQVRAEELELPIPRQGVKLTRAEKAAISSGDTWQQSKAPGDETSPIRGAGNRAIREGDPTSPAQLNLGGTFLSIYRSLQGEDLASLQGGGEIRLPCEPPEVESSDSGEKSWPGEPTISSLLPACSDPVFLELEDLPGANNCPGISNRAEEMDCVETRHCPEDANRAQEDAGGSPRAASSSESSQEMELDTGAPGEAESSPYPLKGPVLSGLTPAKSRFRPPDGFRAPLKRAGKLTVEDLTPYFDMPMSEACKALGIGSTVLKRRCRDLNIPRWPYRKVKSIEGLIRAINELGPSAEGTSAKQVEETLQRLEGEKKRISESPGLTMAQETKKFRQACFNASHKAKKSSKTSAGSRC